MSQWVNIAIYEQTRAMSQEEQKAAVAAIKDEILWEEMQMRFFRNRDRIRGVVKNLRGDDAYGEEI